MIIETKFPQCNIIGLDLSGLSELCELSGITITSSPSYDQCNITGLLDMMDPDLKSALDEMCRETRAIELIEEEIKAEQELSDKIDNLQNMLEL